MKLLRFSFRRNAAFLQANLFFIACILDIAEYLQGVLKSLIVEEKGAMNELNATSFSYQFYHLTMERSFKSLLLSLFERKNTKLDTQ